MAKRQPGSVGEKGACSNPEGGGREGKGRSIPNPGSHGEWA